MITKFHNTNLFGNKSFVIFVFFSIHIRHHPTIWYHFCGESSRLQHTSWDLSPLGRDNFVICAVNFLYFRARYFGVILVFIGGSCSELTLWDSGAEFWSFCRRVLLCWKILSARNFWRRRLSFEFNFAWISDCYSHSYHSGISFTAQSHYSLFHFRASTLNCVPPWV